MYAGDVSVEECWQALETESSSHLVDVRTIPEWQFVGVPDLRSVGKVVSFIEWQRYPDMAVNEHFCSSLSVRLEQLGVTADDSIFMLCRSGARSRAAAQSLTSHGFSKVFNVATGFQGDIDANGHRSAKNGWVFEGYPWIQQ